jgi:hypothetical protein
MGLAAKSVDFTRHFAFLHPHHRDYDSKTHKRQPVP